MIADSQSKERRIVIKMRARNLRWALRYKSDRTGLNQIDMPRHLSTYQIFFVSSHTWNKANLYSRVSSSEIAQTVTNHLRTLITYAVNPLKTAQRCD